MKHIIFLTMTILLLILSVGCSETPPPRQNEVIIDVSVTRAKQVQLEPERTIAGVVQPATRAVLRTRVSGTVEALHVSAGDRVAEGELVVEIDSREIVSNINAAKKQRDAAMAAWQQAKKDLERMQRLYDQALIPKIQVEEAELGEQQARSALAEAEAGLKSLETQMDYARIRAPFSGVVSEVVAEIGSFVGPEPPLIILEDRSRLEILARIDERSMLQLETGDAVDVYLPGPEMRLSGVLESFIPALEAPGTGLSVRLYIDDPPPEARPGMVAHIRTLAGIDQETAVMIPESALLIRGQMEGVFVVREINGMHHARLRWVKTARHINAPQDWIVIQRGIQVGELIVLGEIIETLRDDQPVRYPVRHMDQRVN